MQSKMFKFFLKIYRIGHIKSLKVSEYFNINIANKKAIITEPLR